MWRSRGSISAQSLALLLRAVAQTARVWLFGQGARCFGRATALAGCHAKSLCIDVSEKEYAFFILKIFSSMKMI